MIRPPNASVESAKNSSSKGISFSELAAEYLDKLRREGQGAQTLKKLEWIVSLAEARLGDMEVKDIETQDILARLRVIEAEGKFETAGRLRSTIGAILRYAIATGRATTDPTQALKGALISPKKKHRSALTDKRELGGLMLAIDAYSGEPKTAIALKLLAILAPRPGELRLACWDEFNLDEANVANSGGSDEDAPSASRATAEASRA